jgi:hypothetical protein
LIAFIALNIGVQENLQFGKKSNSKLSFNFKKLVTHLFFGLVLSCLFVMMVILLDRWHPLFDFSDPILKYVVYFLVAVVFSGIVYLIYANRSFVSRCWTDTDYFTIFALASFSALSGFYWSYRLLYSDLDHCLIFWFSFSLSILFVLLLFYRVVFISCKQKPSSVQNGEVSKTRRTKKNKITSADSNTLQSLSDFPVSLDAVKNGLLIQDAPARYDLLDRFGLEERLLTYIKEYQGGKALSIGVKGVWGSGKTSLVDSVLEDSDLPSNYLVIRGFSIWNYATDQSMAEAMISSVLNKLNLGMSAHKIQKLVSAYLSLVFGEIGESFLSKIPDSISSVINGDDDRDDVFSVANRFLKSNHEKIIFVIDDIDRVDEDKILFVYQCVAGILKFKNIVYLMCFDDRLVEAALEKRGLGGAFLNKVLNTSIVVSMPDPALLMTLYKRCLSHLFWNRKGFQKELMDPTSWFFTLVNDCVRCIPTLREFTAYVNAISPFVFSDSSLYVFDYCELVLISVSNPKFYADIREYYPLLNLHHYRKKSSEETDFYEGLLKDKYGKSVEWSVALSILPMLPDAKLNTTDLLKGNARLFQMKYFYLYFTLGDNFFSQTLKSLADLNSKVTTNENGISQLSVLYDEDPDNFLSVLRAFVPSINGDAFRETTARWVVGRYWDEIKKEDSNIRIINLLAEIISVCFTYLSAENGKKLIDEFCQNDWRAIPVLEQIKQAYNYDDPNSEEDVKKITEYALQQETQKIKKVIDGDVFKKESYVKGLFVMLYQMSDSEYRLKLSAQVCSENVACFLFDFVKHNLAASSGYAYDLEARQIEEYIPLDKVSKFLPAAEINENAKKVIHLYKTSLANENDLVEEDFRCKITSSSLLAK